QPCPGCPLLPHGQAIPEPSPKQYGSPVVPLPCNVITNEPGAPLPDGELPTCSRYVTPPMTFHVAWLCTPQLSLLHARAAAVGHAVPAYTASAVSSVVCPHVSMVAAPFCEAVHVNHRSLWIATHPPWPCE